MENKVVEILDAVIFATRQCKIDLDAVVPLGAGGLHAPAADRSVRTDILKVNSRRNYLDVVQRELRSLGNDLAVDGYHCTAVVVEPIAVTALLVRVKVDTSELCRRCQ